MTMKDTNPYRIRKLKVHSATSFCPFCNFFRLCKPLSTCQVLNDHQLCLCLFILSMQEPFSPVLHFREGKEAGREGKKTTSQAHIIWGAECDTVWGSAKLRALAWSSLQFPGLCVSWALVTGVGGSETTLWLSPVVWHIHTQTLPEPWPVVTELTFPGSTHLPRPHWPNSGRQKRAAWVTGWFRASVGCVNVNVWILGGHIFVASLIWMGLRHFQRTYVTSTDLEALSPAAVSPMLRTCSCLRPFARALSPGEGTWVDQCQNKTNVNHCFPSSVAWQVMALKRPNGLFIQPWELRMFLAVVKCYTLNGYRNTV